MKYLRKQLIRAFISKGTEIVPVGYIICDTLYPLSMWRKKAKKGYAGKKVVYMF